jgi:hypothetical protein
MLPLRTASCLGCPASSRARFGTGARLGLVENWMFHGSPEKGERACIDSRARVASSTRSNSTKPTTLPVRSLRIRHDSKPVKPRKWRSSADSGSSGGSSGRKSVCVGCVRDMLGRGGGLRRGGRHGRVLF